MAYQRTPNPISSPTFVPRQCHRDAILAISRQRPYHRCRTGRFPRICCAGGPMLSHHLTSLARVLRSRSVVRIVVLAGSAFASSPTPTEAQTWDPWVRVAVWAGYSHHCNGCDFPGSWRGGQFVLRFEITPWSPFSSPGANPFGTAASRGLGSSYFMPWVKPPGDEEYEFSVAPPAGQDPASGGALLSAREHEEIRVVAGSGYELDLVEWRPRLWCAADVPLRAGQLDRTRERLRHEFSGVVSLGVTWRNDATPPADTGRYAFVSGGPGLVGKLGAAYNYFGPDNSEDILRNAGLHVLFRKPFHLDWSDLTYPPGNTIDRGWQWPGAREAWEVLVGVSLPFGRRKRLASEAGPVHLSWTPQAPNLEEIYVSALAVSEAAQQFLGLLPPPAERSFDQAVDDLRLYADSLAALAPPPDRFQAQMDTLARMSGETAQLADSVRNFVTTGRAWSSPPVFTELSDSLQAEVDRLIISAQDLRESIPPFPQFREFSERLLQLDRSLQEGKDRLQSATATLLSEIDRRVRIPPTKLEQLRGTIAQLSDSAGSTVALFERSADSLRSDPMGYTAQVDTLIENAKSLEVQSRAAARTVESVIAAPESRGLIRPETELGRAVQRVLDAPMFADQYRDMLLRKQIMCGHPE